MLVLAAACGGRRGTAPAQLVAGAPTVQLPSGPFALSALFNLQFADSGVAVPDTSVILSSGSARTIVLRHAANDLDVFAAVTVNAGSFADGRPVTLRLAPIKGLYGLDIQADQPMLVPLTLEFRYGRHFTPPPGAIERFLTPVGFERALAIAQQSGDSAALLLPSSRPALDFLAASIPSNGRYFVAAPQ